MWRLTDDYTVLMEREETQDNPHGMGRERTPCPVSQTDYKADSNGAAVALKREQAIHRQNRLEVPGTGHVSLYATYL